jgi:hypothetical protein
MEKKPVRILGSVLAGILLFALVFEGLSVFFPHAGADIPHITPDSSSLQTPPVIATHTFPFETTNVTISIPVNYSVYAGAKRTDRNSVYVGNATEITAEVYRSMINDPSQEPLFRDLLAQFRNISREQNLSDDESLELMIVYVQSLPYTVVPDAPAKYPIETVMDGTGDCDDKSLLLAGLLSREGYPVVLYLFGPEHHMALGVGSDAYLYKSTGYSYIEATDYSYVGVPSYRMKGNETLKSDPQVIPISQGTKRYHRGNETDYIDTMSALSGRKAAEFSTTFNRMTSMRDNQSEYLAVFSELNRYSTIHNYVLAHKFDRKGVFEYLKKAMPEDSV